MTQEKSWSKKDQQRLIELYQLGDKFNEIATKLNRTYSSIASEVQELRKAGKLGYRKSNAEAAANERGLFKPDPVEFEDNGVMIRPSDEETEQTERAERKAITTQTQMRNWEAMTAKSAQTNTIFNEILENIKYTHDKKNDDYKDSYSDTMKRFGTKSGLVRIYDKFNRIENILDSDKAANFESAEDNLQDLATYAIMMLAYIKKGDNK